MFRRVLGLVILLSTLVVIAVLAATAYFFGPALDTVTQAVDEGLVLTVDTLETVSTTLEQTKATLVTVNTSIDTAAATTANLSQTVTDTIPLLDQVSVVVTEQLPDNVEAIQSAIPNIAAVAGVVDVALRKLSDFGIQQTIPIPFNPIEIDFDLGIEYDPVEPFDQTMESLGTSLEGLPEELRMLSDELETSAANLETLGRDLETASGDIVALNTEVAKFIPLLDQYLDLLDRAIGGIDDIRVQITDSLANIRLAGTILPLVMALTQLAPLVVGWDLLFGRRDTEEDEREVGEQEPVDEIEPTYDEISEREEQKAEETAEDTLSEVQGDENGDDEGEKS